MPGDRNDQYDRNPARAAGSVVTARVSVRWSVTVRFVDGSTNSGSGEFAEIDAPHKLVMTRRFEKHPLQGTRETTITYRLDPIATGTRVTVRDEGYVGAGCISAGICGLADDSLLGWIVLSNHEPQDHIPGVADARDEKEDAGPRQSGGSLTAPQEQPRAGSHIHEITGHRDEEIPRPIVHIDHVSLILLPHERQRAEGPPELTRPASTRRIPSCVRVTVGITTTEAVTST
jgi:hypothetical protein